MPLKIVRADLANVRADAVVLPSNERLIIDGGVGGHVAKKAGAFRLRLACRKIGRCRVGSAVYTSAFSFPAKYLIHAVGPVWRGDQADSALLLSAYRSSLELAAQLDCESVALPLLSAGSFGCPAHISLSIALSAIEDFLSNNDMDVLLVLFDRKAVAAGLDFIGEIESRIDDRYVARITQDNWAGRMEGASPTAVLDVSATSLGMPAAQAREIPYKAKKSRKLWSSIASLREKGESAQARGYSADEAEQAVFSDDESVLETEPTPGAVPTFETALASEAAPTLESAAIPGAALAPVTAPCQDEDPVSETASDLGVESFLEGSTGEFPPIPRPSEENDVPRPGDSAAWAAAPVAEVQDVLPAPSALSLEERLGGMQRGFSETLLGLIDESGKTDAQVYRRANMSRQHFSKIRNNVGYRPTKPTVLALCVALELDLAHTQDLLERAGFAFSPASKFDIIVEYFIEKGVFDPFKINETLFYFDQPLLGG